MRPLHPPPATPRIPTQPRAPGPALAPGRRGRLPVPRRADWRSGLGFTAPVPPATDEETAALRAADPESFAAATMSQRRAAVAASARHAWRGYRQHAWPADELAPVSRRGVSWLDVGLTVVDSHDTLLLMGLDEEAADARAWLASSALTFDSDKNANVFESTIRMLGGLVSAHTLGGDTPDGDLLRKALDLAEKLAPAFQTATGIPIMDVNFKTGDPHHPKWTQKSSLSEAGTLVLEWEALEEALRRAENVTVGRDDEDERDADSDRDADGDDDAVEVMYGFCPEGGGLKEYAAPRGVSCEGDGLTPRARVVVERRRRPPSPRSPGDGIVATVADAVWHPENDGLVPTAVSAGTAAFDRGSAVTLGAHGDSYYEYLLKHWLHAGKPEGGEAAYLRAMDGVATHLLRRSGGDERREAAAEAAAEKRSAAAAAFAASVGVRWNVAGTGTATPSRSRRRRWFDADPVEDRRAPREPSSPPPAGPGLLYVAERRGGVDGEMSHKMDHLACFPPGRSRWGTPRVWASDGAEATTSGNARWCERFAISDSPGTPPTSTSPENWRARACRCTRERPRVSRRRLRISRSRIRSSERSRGDDVAIRGFDRQGERRAQPPAAGDGGVAVDAVAGDGRARVARRGVGDVARVGTTRQGGFRRVRGRRVGAARRRRGEEPRRQDGEFLVGRDAQVPLPALHRRSRGAALVLLRVQHRGAPRAGAHKRASDRSACVERVVREHAETIAARHATPPRYE